MAAAPDDRSTSDEPGRQSADRAFGFRRLDNCAMASIAPTITATAPFLFDDPIEKLARRADVGTDMFVYAVSENVVCNAIVVSVSTTRILRRGLS
jgi:hypothetical protein